MRRRSFILVGFTVLLGSVLGLPAGAEAGIIFMSPNGPVATLEQARDLLRQQKSSAGPNIRQGRRPDAVAASYIPYQVHQESR